MAYNNKMILTFKDGEKREIFFQKNKENEMREHYKPGIKVKRYPLMTKHIVEKVEFIMNN